jgi:Family of unknown function (DUF5819)
MSRIFQKTGFSLGLRVAIVMLVIFHIGLTILYCLPPNPLKTLTSIQDQYIGNFFYQRWTLFAPNPVNTNYGMSVNCKAKLHQTGAVDVTSPLVADHMQNRFSPMERVARVPDNTLHAVLFPDESYLQLVKICRTEPNQPQCKNLEAAKKSKIDFHINRLVKVASAVCADLSSSSGHQYQTVSIFAKIQDIPRWSKRNSKPKPMKYVNLGTHAILPSKAFGIWE